MSGACNHCGQSSADLLHMFWTCSRICENFKCFKDISGVDIPLNPLTALFGAPPSTNTPVHLNRIMSFTSLPAKRLIVIEGKHITPTPTTYS